MPAIICYVHADGREVQFRVRFSRRVAIPLSDWPEPPANLLLVCPGFVADLKLTGIFNGFAVFYVSSIAFEYIVDLMRRLCSTEPCRLPCVLSVPQPPPS